MKSVFGKVMWMGRATVFLVGLSVILAAVFTIASMAFAANGKPFILGKNNVATAITTLTKQGPGPALRLLVRPGQPPMAVNSKVRVANLNADMVDGKSAEQLTRVAGMETGATTVLPTDFTSVTYGQPLPITAPAPGFVRVNGNATIRNVGCTTGCVARGIVRHVNTGSTSLFGEDDVGNFRGNISFDKVFPVSAGVNTFDIRLMRFVDGNGTLNGWYGMLTAEYTPYGSTGEVGTLGSTAASASEGIEK